MALWLTTLLLASNALAYTSYSKDGHSRLTFDAPTAVFAQFQVAKAQLYSVQDWWRDIQAASLYDIDGFMLVVGAPNWHQQKVKDAFKALSHSETDFNLVLAFDMSSFPCSKADHAKPLVKQITEFALRPGYFVHPPTSPHYFVTTVNDEHCTFGEQTLDEGWQNNVLNKISNIPIYSIPSCSDADHTEDVDGYVEVLQGNYEWQPLWPNLNATRDAARSGWDDDMGVPQIHISGNFVGAAVKPLAHSIWSSIRK